MRGGNTEKVIVSVVRAVTLQIDGETLEQDTGQKIKESH